MREIITIQLGKRANYLATHFWNTQESYHTFPPAPPSPVNHDIHFRQGIDPDGSETYLPRTLIYDLKDGFGSLRRFNALGVMDSDERAQEIWNGPLTRLPRQPQYEPSPYAQSLLASLEPVPPTPATTSYFADFASTYYHPKSLLPVQPPYPTIHTSGSIARETPTSAAANLPNQFTTFEAGSALFASRDSDIDILDTDLRPWIEECDGLQAIQLFTSSDDSWSGFTTKYVERLRDELGKGSIWVWGLDNSVASSQSGAAVSQTRAKLRENATNAALALREIIQNASAYVPLALPQKLPSNVRLDRDVLWHTAGLLSAAIETATLPVRLADRVSTRVSTLQDWEDVLSGGGRRRVAGLNFGLISENTQTSRPASDNRMRSSYSTAEDDVDDEDITAELDKTLNTSFFPESPYSTILPNTGKAKPKRSKTFARIESFRSEDSSSSILPPRIHDRAVEGRSPIVEIYNSPFSFPLLTTFPPIFPPTPKKSLSMHASLATSSRVVTWARSLEKVVRMGFGGELGGEEREGLANGLAELADTYVKDWESGGESDDDDDDE